MAKETLYLPQKDYMEQQEDLKPRMRGIALEWVTDVAYKFKLLPETLFLAVNYMDRFLSRMQVQKNDLQLLLVSSLKIAGKYEEIYPPDNKDYLYVCDNAYDEDQLLKCERQVL